jgi:hypothetical protein
MARNLREAAQGHPVESTISAVTSDRDLMVIVPRGHLERARILEATLRGTTIRVVIDRRLGERRREYRAADAERRDRDRRATTRVVGYVYACPVVEIGPRPTAVRGMEHPARELRGSARRMGAEPEFHAGGLDGGWRTD